MKSIISFLCIIMVASVASAQHRPSHAYIPSIETIITDLSPWQKRQLENISLESKVKVDAIKHEINEVRDSVRVLLDDYGDKSAILFPLFERESKLDYKLNEELYRTKIKVDKVLTAEQQQTFQKKMAAQRKLDMQKKKTGHPACPPPQKSKRTHK